jgi:hypothetical protein
MYETRELPLPDKLSDLIQMALGDLMKVEQNGNYEIDMNSWHMPRPNNLCRVCMAGAVLARFLKPDEYCSSPEGMFDRDTLLKLLAIDLVRVGCLRTAAACLGRTYDGHVDLIALPNRQHPRYEIDPAAFRNSISNSIIILRNAGF